MAELREGQSIARHIPRFTNAGETRTLGQFIKKFDAEVSTTSPDIPSLLFSIARYSSNIGLVECLSPDHISPPAIATACYALLTFCKSPRPLYTDDQKILDYSPYVLAILREAEGVNEDAFLYELSDPKSQAPFLILFRMICESAVFQEEALYKIVNALVLSGLRAFRELPASPIKVNSLFSEFLGVTAEEYFYSLALIWTQVQKSPAFGPNRLSLQNDNPEQSRKNLFAICEELSCWFDDFYGGGKVEQFNRYGGKGTSSAYFARKPLVKVAEDKYLSICHPFFRLQLTSKFLQKALFFSREKERREQPTNINPGRTAFSSFVGTERLEGFFRELCRHWGPPRGHVDEYCYDKRSTKKKDKSPDRIVFDQVNHRETTILIQLKLKSLTEDAHFAYSKEELLKNFQSAFSELVVQSVKFLKNLEASERASALCSENEKTSKRILQANDFFFLGIVPDLPPIFSIPFIRAMLAEKIAEHLKPDLVEWIKRKFPQGIKWHIIELVEFEIFLAIAKNRTISLHQELLEYLRASQSTAPIFDEQGRIPISFRAYLIRKYGSGIGEKRRLNAIIPELASIFERFMGDAIKHFLRSGIDASEDHEEVGLHES